MRNFLSCSLFFVSILLIFLTSLNIYNNGIKRTTLSDELFSNDHELLKYQYFKRHFNIENHIQLIIGKKDKNQLKEEDLIKINQLTKDMLQNITGLSSYSLIEDIALPILKNNKIGKSNLIKNNKINQKTLKELKKSSLFNKTVFSKRNKIIILQLTLGDNGRKNIENSILNLTEKIKVLNLKTKYQFDLYGLEYFRYSLYNEVKRSYFIQLPIIILLISTIILLIFKNVLSLMAAGLTIGLSFLTSFSIVYLYSQSFSPLSSLGLLLIFIIGTSDIIHLLSAISQQDPLLTNKEKVKNAIKLTFAPCLLTSLTTFIALFSLMLSDIKTLHLFGFYACIGVIMCFMATFYILPWTLDLFNWPNITPPNKQYKGLHFRYNPARKKFYLYSTFVILTLATFGISKLEFKDDYHNKFVKNHPINNAISTITREFQYDHYIDLVYDTRLISNEKIEIIRKKILKIKNARGSLSEIEFARDINKKINDIKVSEKILHYLTLFDKNLFTSLVNPYKKRMLIQVHSINNRELQSITKNINETLKKFNAQEEISVEGFTLFRNQYFERLKKSFLKSGLFSIVLITFLFIIYFKSISTSLVALIINISPLCIIIALMGFYHISADMNLPLISSLLFGICVDDTIHFLHHFKKNHQKDNDIDKALNSTLKTLSLPVVTTSLLFIATLFVFNLSQVTLINQLSRLLSLGFFIAMVFDLFFLPPLLSSFSKNFSIFKEKK